MNQYVKDEIQLTHSVAGTQLVRSGWRSILDCSSINPCLAHFLGGQIPYYYRSPDRIANDFVQRHNALDMISDLVTKLPSNPKFQQSHCGEILCSLYLENILGFTRLFSKLTLTTSEDTNVHKMDAFLVDLREDPHLYVSVEAKTSILPTAVTKFSGHRHGILQKMIQSLESYDANDQRFDFTVIRDSLEQNNFTTDQAARIRRDLIPPGPPRMLQLGMSAINVTTVCVEDDDFVLTQSCKTAFDYRALIVTDLAKLANEAYGKLLALK